MVHVSPGPAMYQLKWKCGTREGENRLPLHVALFHYRVESQALLKLGVTGGAEKGWSRPLAMIMKNEGTLGLVPCGSLISLNCLDQFAVDPAITPVRVTGHQLVTLCRSVCADERAQLLDPLMGSKYLTTYSIAFVVFLSSLHFLVHRIRCRFPAFGTECCTFWSTCC